MRHLRSSYLIGCCLLAIGATLGTGGLTVAAQVPPPRPPATSLFEVDEDYAFQGEYYGTLGMVGSGPWQTTGLQIVAQGGGDYIATEYPGGLPGIGWSGGPTAHLRGRREPDRLTLMGDRPRYEVADGIAWLIDENGHKLTWLKKVDRISSTRDQPPPPNAIVLFNGLDTSRLDNAHLTPNGLLKEGAKTRDTYQDYFLHVEFQLPYMPYARGQRRANSGVILQGREVQILDSFGLEGLSNECGAIYGFYRPELNMCLPPLAWQTYDIDFRSARFDVRGHMTENAWFTVWHNGYAVQEHTPVWHLTGKRGPDTPDLHPIEFQNHGNPVRFRNIWLVVNSKEAGQYDSGLQFNSYQQPGSSVFGNVELPQRYGFYWLGR
jgi:hypothetical protein